MGRVLCNGIPYGLIQACGCIGWRSREVCAVVRIVQHSVVDHAVEDSLRDFLVEVVFEVAAQLCRARELLSIYRPHHAVDLSVVGYGRIHDNRKRANLSIAGNASAYKPRVFFEHGVVADRACGYERAPADNVMVPPSTTAKSSMRAFPETEPPFTTASGPTNTLASTFALLLTRPPPLLCLV